MEKPKIAGIIVIATGKYDKFLPDLFFSADKYFMGDHDIDIYLFSDKDYELSPSLSMGMTLHRFKIPHLPFPLPTLYRYRWISEFAEHLTAENLFYIDADMLFVGSVGEEIIPPRGYLTATYHPGFYRNKGWGDCETPIDSTAYLRHHQRHDYFCGGFQGGSRDAFVTASKMMSEGIDIDFDTARDMGWTKNGGVLARWHDESHWNHYLKYNDKFITLSPEYCMVEQVELRNKWGIDDLTPRIVALKKDHQILRD